MGCSVENTDIQPEVVSHIGMLSIIVEAELLPASFMAVTEKICG